MQGRCKRTRCPRSLPRDMLLEWRKLPCTCGAEALLAKSINFAAVRSEIDMGIERAA